MTVEVDVSTKQAKDGTEEVDVVVKAPLQKPTDSALPWPFDFDLSTIEDNVRGRLYSEYLDQCKAVAPQMRKKGRSFGEELMLSMLGPATVRSLENRGPYSAPSPSLVHGYLFNISTMRAASVHISTETNTDSATAGTTSSTGQSSGRELVSQPASKDDEPETMMKRLEPLLTPVMDPFVEGLSEPFVEVYGRLKVILGTSFVVSSIACGVIGYFVGRHIERRSDYR